MVLDNLHLLDMAILSGLSELYPGIVHDECQISDTLSSLVCFHMFSRKYVNISFSCSCNTACCNTIMYLSQSYSSRTWKSPHDIAGFCESKL